MGASPGVFDGAEGESVHTLGPGVERRGEEAARRDSQEGAARHLGQPNLLPPVRHRCGVSFRCRRSVADHGRRGAGDLSITVGVGLSGRARGRGAWGIDAGTLRAQTGAFAAVQLVIRWVLHRGGGSSGSS